MKKTVFHIIITALFVLTTASSCRKDEPDEPQLPTGENTMYYYLDGELIIPKAEFTGGGTVPAISVYYCTGDSFTISTLKYYLHFHDGIQETGTITLDQSNYDICYVPHHHAFHSIKELGGDGVIHNIAYYTHDGSGTVTITSLSADKRKFKGTFNMTLYHETTDVEMQITDGHFNINLDTL